MPPTTRKRIKKYKMEGGGCPSSLAMIIWFMKGGEQEDILRSEIPVCSEQMGPYALSLTWQNLKECLQIQADMSVPQHGTKTANIVLISLYTS